MFARRAFSTRVTTIPMTAPFIYNDSLSTFVTENELAWSEESIYLHAFLRAYKIYDLLYTAEYPNTNNLNHFPATMANLTAMNNAENIEAFINAAYAHLNHVPRLGATNIQNAVVNNQGIYTVADNAQGANAETLRALNQAFLAAGIADRRHKKWALDALFCFLRVKSDHLVSPTVFWNVLAYLNVAYPPTLTITTQPVAAGQNAPPEAPVDVTLNLITAVPGNYPADAMDTECTSILYRYSLDLHETQVYLAHYNDLILFEQTKAMKSENVSSYLKQHKSNMPSLRLMKVIKYAAASMVDLARYTNFGEVRASSDFAAYRTNYSSTPALVKMFIEDFAGTPVILCSNGERTIVNNAFENQHDKALANMIPSRLVAMAKVYYSVCERKIGTWYQGDKALSIVGEVQKTSWERIFKRYITLKSNREAIDNATTLVELGAAFNLANPIVEVAVVNGEDQNNEG